MLDKNYVSRGGRVVDLLSAFLPAATLGAVRSMGAKVWCSSVRPLLVQPYIIFACMVFCGYLDIWTADVNFGKMIM